MSQHRGPCHVFRAKAHIHIAISIFGINEESAIKTSWLAPYLIAEEVSRSCLFHDLSTVMKTMWSATSLAKPISCVAQSMVIPPSASSAIVSSTSLTISGAMAEVGSSSRRIFGLRTWRGQSQRVVADRRTTAMDISRLLGDRASTEKMHCYFLGFLAAHVLDGHDRKQTIFQHIHVWKQVETLERQPTSRRILFRLAFT